MAHNLFGERFAGYRRPAWHGLGTVFENRLTAEEALSVANMDYHINKRPVFYKTETADGTPSYSIIEGQVALVRDATVDDPAERVFGIVSADYGLLQNIDLGRVLNGLSQKWPVETVGALGNGETVFLTLDAGLREFGEYDEALQLFYLVTDTRTGLRSMQIAFTPVRVVCQNTLVTGMSQSVVNVSLTHTANVASELEFQVSLIQQLENAQANVLKVFEQLMGLRIGADKLRAIVDAAYPIPQKPQKLGTLDVFEFSTLPEEVRDSITEAMDSWNMASKRMLERREAAWDLLTDMNDRFKDIANTPWAAYNAVVETEDYRRAVGDGTGADRQALFGERAMAKQRAFAAAEELLSR
jgi:phage/plasmid-like protein (TIGR03299 family)